MPKYKIGDVAALFPQPKESTTETGKKLQSLFSQFHNKKNKTLPQASQEYAKPEKKIMTQNEKTESPSNSTKVKKRKFSSLEVATLETNVNDIIKKFKHTDDLEKIKFPKNKEDKGKNSSSTEIDFPRRKKKGNKFNFGNSQSNRFPDTDLSENSPQKLSFAQNKVSNINSGQNSKLGFIKKAKHQNRNKNTEIASTDNSFKKPLYTNDYTDTLFKNDNKKQKIKNKSKKKKWENSGLVKVDQVETSNLNEPDFIQVSEIKGYHDSSVQKSKPGDSVLKKKVNLDKRELMLRRPEDEEVLSRTLFVGNLPTNTTGKVLKKFFSTFGPVENVRYFPIETDRNKIYKHGGPKGQNLHYAAESVPGFIVFKNRQNAVDALAVSGSLFENRHITVDFAQAAGSRKLYDDKRSVFIGNLSFDIQDESVWNAFSECGKIDGVRIVRDRLTGIGKGFGYVQFSSVQSKENALALEDLKIEGRSIRVKAVDSNQKKIQKKPSDKTTFNKDPFKSRAINYKKTHKDMKSRKTVKKIMNKQKNLHKKKKVASLMQKSMK